MRHAAQQRVSSLAQDNPSSRRTVRLGETPLRLHAPVEVPIAAVEQRLPTMIPEERLDYYAWVFHQRGFSSDQMTFEQFLAVIAAVHPSGLCPGYDPIYVREGHFV